MLRPRWGRGGALSCPLGRYDQADAVNPWFQRLVGTWAQRLSPEAGAAWKSVSVKKARRSIEKIRRSYFAQVYAFVLDI